MNYPAMLSFVCGFASLSLEILWVRFYSFVHLSTPAAFGFVLMAYLLGIAFGARWGGVVCRKVSDEKRLWHYSAGALLLSALMSILLPAIFSILMVNDANAALLDFLIIAIASSILAFVFPIAHHLGTEKFQEKQGKHFAAVYTSNVFGAALGPLITGYILLEFFSLQQSFLLIAGVQASAAILFIAALDVRYWQKTCVAASIGVIGGAFVVNGLFGPHSVITELTHFKEHPHTVISNHLKLTWNLLP